MNLLKRNIYLQENFRLVEGVYIKRDADFGILFEKNHFLQIVKEVFFIDQKNIDYYSGWDREVLHYTLKSGAVIAMMAVQGAPFAASGVERFVRSGVSHIVRIGTSGSLSSDVNIWDIVINNSALIDESTSIKYKEENQRSSLKTILEEFLCPVGCLHHCFTRMPSALQYIFNKLNSKYIDYYLSYSNSALDKKIKIELDKITGKNYSNIHNVRNYTVSARYLENKQLISSLKKVADIKTIDMETAAILTSSAFHDIPATAINIIIDSPVDAVQINENIKSTYRGIPCHSLYEKIIPEKIKDCTKAVFNTFEKISQNKDYRLLATFLKKS